ncbi:MAG: hypothetical protein RIT14_948 [Pseudomonadota bacterium]
MRLSLPHPALAPLPALALLLAALPGMAGAAAGDTPMSPAEFEAYATGKTLSYAQGDEIWGSEQYLPGRKVIWAFADEDCQYGTWFEDAGAICFVYETDPAPQCWRFFRGPGGLRAEFLDDPAGTSLSEVSQSKTPLSCPGPDVGV